MTKIRQLFISMIKSIAFFVTVGKWRAKDVFNDMYEGQIKSQTLRSIFRNAFGDDYPEEADPSSFVTMTDLQCIAKYLGIGKGKTFVDLACGCGGPGLWVARKIGAKLTGIDISDIAIEHATHRIADFGLDEQASFWVGDFCNTGFPDESYDGAISIDSLWIAMDKTVALQEVSRILRLGARFVFTTWEINRPLMVRDYRPFLQNTGFEVEVYDETPDWKRRQRAVYKGVLSAKDTLIEEMGRASARGWIFDARGGLPSLARMCRILVVARKC